jgi:putative radical SAM enzyme (TIGR03279 family)
VKKPGVLIIAVEPESLAAQAGIQAGDRLLEINGEPVLDQLSYQFLISQRDDTTLTFQSPDDRITTSVVANGENGVGLDLAEDEVRVCRQNCVFCFVLQMPKGFRKSLYLKDEDIRLSFLYGHFSTLSSSNDAELDRVIRERLSPIHVSVHATDPEVRVKVVGNKKEGDILRKVDRLLAGGVDMHTQVVVAPGLNDDWVWEKTVRELWERRAFQTLGPWAGKGGVLSLSCVPVGLTAHREGLPQVTEVSADYAHTWVKRWTPEVRKYTEANAGEPWLLLADEWFTRAGLEVPGRSFYSHSWAQLENGVGLIRRFLEHSRRFLGRPKAQGFAGRRALLLTGASFAPVLNDTLAKLNRKAASHLRAAAVRNFTFGESVTVAGLLCGKDLKYAAEADRQAHGGNPHWVDAVVVPSSSLRTHTGPTDQYTLSSVAHPEARAMFLDDVTLAELSRDLGVPVVPGGENLSQLLENLRIAERGVATFHTAGMSSPQGAYLP